MTTPIADMVEQMLSGGIPPEFIILAIRTAEQHAEAVAGEDPVAAKRRAYDRERKRASKSGGIPAESAPLSPPKKVSPITPSKITPSIPKDIRTNEDFEKFKKTYPRRKGSNPWPPAQKLFEEAVRKGASPEEIIRCAARYAEEEKSNVGTPYISQAMKWLRQQCWTDSQPAPATTVDELITILIGDPSWNAWLAYNQDNGKHFAVKLMNGAAEANRRFVVPSLWPPGHQHLQAAE